MAGQCARGGGGNLPAGLRCAGNRLGIDAQQQQRHTRPFGRQRQPTAGGEIQFAHRSPAFHDHGTQPLAAQCIHRTAQQRPDIRNDADQAARRHPTQFGPAIGLKHAHHSCRAPCAQPHKGAFRTAHSCCQRGGEPACGTGITRFGCIDFVDPAMSQPASYCRIKRSHVAGPATSLHRRCAIRH